jgi:hypothetical protein
MITLHFSICLTTEQCPYAIFLPLDLDSTQNWAGGMAQVVEHLCSKPEALISRCKYRKKKKKN